MADSGHIRKIYITGFVIFAASSLVCGLSQNLMTLVAARCAQGVGAAMLAAVTVCGQAELRLNETKKGGKVGLETKTLYVQDDEGNYTEQFNALYR